MWDVACADKQILITNNKYIGKNLFYEFIQPFLKTGLLTANDKKWMKRRRILTPAFHFNILNGFSLTFRYEYSKLLIVKLLIFELDWWIMYLLYRR